MQQVVMEVIGVIRNATRAEDELYQLDDSDILFAMLMLTRKEGLSVIHGRLKEAIAQINTSDILNTRQLVLDMRIGMAFDDGGQKSVMELLQSAKDSMQYDV
jgi:GGDEF domain-containing protein